MDRLLGILGDDFRVVRQHLEITHQINGHPIFDAAIPAHFATIKKFGKHFVCVVGGQPLRKQAQI